MHSTNITTGAQQSMHAPTMSPRKENTCITKHQYNKTPQLQMQAAEVEPHRAQTHPIQNKHQIPKTHPSQRELSSKETHPHPFLHPLRTSSSCQQNADACKKYLCPPNNTLIKKKKKDKSRTQQDNKYPLQYTPSSGDRQGTKTKTEEKASIGGAPCSRGGCTRGSHRQRRRQQQQQRGGVPSLSPS